MLGLIIHLDCFKNKFFSFNLQSNSNFIRNFNEIDKEKTVIVHDYSILVNNKSTFKLKISTYKYLFFSTFVHKKTEIET